MIFPSHTDEVTFRQRVSAADQHLSSVIFHFTNIIVLHPDLDAVDGTKSPIGLFSGEVRSLLPDATTFEDINDNDGGLLAALSSLVDAVAGGVVVVVGEFICLGDKERWLLGV